MFVITIQEIWEEKQKIQELAKKKTIQKRFPIMLDEYVKIAGFLIDDYKISNVPEIMQESYVKVFKNFDIKTKMKMEKTDGSTCIAGFHHNIPITKTSKVAHRIAINPYTYSQGEYVEQVYDEQNTPDKQKKFVYQVDAQMLGQGYQTVFDDDDEIMNDSVLEKIERINGLDAEEKHNSKQILTHEMLHSFAKREKVETRIHKDETEDEQYVGGTKNSNLHEGMTEYLNALVIGRRPKYYHVVGKYAPTYAPYVMYVQNINIAFKNSVQDIYFNGISARKKKEYRDEDYSADKFMSEFAILDDAIFKINTLMESAESGKVVRVKTSSGEIVKRKVKIDYDEKFWKHFDGKKEIIENLYSKQCHYFDKLQKEGRITESQCNNMKNGLFYFVDKTLKQKTIKSTVIVRENNEIKILVKNGFIPLLKENKLTEKNIMAEKKLSKQLNIKDDSKMVNNVMLTNYIGVRNTKTPNPDNLYVEDFYVLHNFRSQKLGFDFFDKQKLSDKVPLDSFVVLFDGTIAFTDKFADLELNGFNVTGAIKLLNVDGVWTMSPNEFIKEKKEGLLSLYNREDGEINKEKKQNLTEEQTMALLKVTKLLQVPLLDINIAPNINLSQKALKEVKYDENGVAQKESLLRKMAGGSKKIASHFWGEKEVCEKTKSNALKNADEQTFDKK